MGGFYELSPEEASALNANDGREPLTYELYMPHRKRGDEGATFRLYWKPPALTEPPGHEPAQEQEQDAQGSAMYAVYDARALWDWLKSHERDPTNSFKVPREDWMELRDAFDPTMPIPDFVRQLPQCAWPDFGPGTTWVRREGGTHWYCGSPWDGHCWSAYVDGRECFRTFTKGQFVGKKTPTDGFYLEGPSGAESIARVEHAGWTSHYSGPAQGERCYKTVKPSGCAMYYDVSEEEGVRTRRSKPKMEFWSDEARGRLYKSVNKKGNITKHYQGPKGHERVTRYDADCPTNGRMTIHQTGKRGKERLTKVVRHDVGDVLYHKGSKGQEYIATREMEHHTVYYHGKRKCEAVRTIVKRRPNQSPFVAYCEGPRDGEWFTRFQIQLSDGRTLCVPHDTKPPVPRAWGARARTCPVLA